ncbi:MAG TPA: MotA/TolQ/ExbB proton channel family protein [Geminicoccaceae bacterium]|nr:MotA/TolQ/ExbB proton channel family protein [Geminicoccaceae bacterium]
MLSRSRRPWIDREHVLLLKGLALLAVVGLVLLAAWRCGLLRRVWHEDSTGISVAITVVFLLAAAQGSLCLVRVAQALRQLAAVQCAIGDHNSTGVGLPHGCVGRYIRDLHTKASLSGWRPTDQSLLLDSFEAELRQGHLFGGFVADLLLSLGLLGTVLGLAVMLGSGGGLGLGEQSTIESALAGMSRGMAIALYATLAALIGGMLLKIQGFLLDRAVDELIRRMTRLTEVHILPAIEGAASAAAPVAAAAAGDLSGATEQRAGRSPRGL